MQANYAQAAAAVAAAGKTGDAAKAGDDMAILVLDSRGMIRDCNRAGETLFKYRRSEMVWRHVSMLLPQLAELDLVPDGQPNPHLRYLSRIGRHFQAATRDGESFASELFLNLLDSTGQGRLSLLVRPAAEGIPPTDSAVCGHGDDAPAHVSTEFAQ